jgi:hypothetical protein
LVQVDEVGGIGGLLVSWSAVSGDEGQVVVECCVVVPGAAVGPQVEVVDVAKDLEPLFTAANRTLGETALPFYDELITDETIPSASFLWYRRQDCIAYLATDPKHDTSGTVERLLRPS